MVRFLTRTAAVVLAAAALPLPGGAADLGRRQTSWPSAPYQAVPLYHWTGVTAGGYAGYAAATGSVAALGLKEEAGFDGFVGGGFVGYDYETQGALLGIEADLLGGSVDRSWTWTAPWVVARYSAELDYLGTVRGRLGYADGPLMVYVSGGWAYGGIVQRASIAGVEVFRDRNTLAGGYTVGAGLDAALTAHLFARIDYRYFDLGDSTTVFAGVPYTIRVDGHIVQGGLGVKF